MTIRETVVGSMPHAGGMYRDEVYISDLSDELQVLVMAACDWSSGRYFRIKMAADAFSASVKVRP